MIPRVNKRVKIGRIIYCGYWLRDRFHNRGKLYYYDLQKQIDLTIEDIKNQKKINENRVSYTGEFDLGEIKGLGQMLFDIGGGLKCVYYGRFVNGYFHGKGNAVLYKESLEKQGDQTIQGEWCEGMFL
jgi:hypothetical protein